MDYFIGEIAYHVAYDKVGALYHSGSISGRSAERYEQNDQFFRKLFDDPDMMQQVMETVGSVLYERLKKKLIFDPKSGVERKQRLRRMWKILM